MKIPYKVGVLTTAALALSLAACGRKEEIQKYTATGRPYAAVAEGNYVSIAFVDHGEPILKTYAFSNPANASKICAVVQAEMTWGDSAEIQITENLTNYQLLQLRAMHFPVNRNFMSPEKDW